MPVDISELLINSAAAFGIGVLWYHFTRWSFETFIKPHSEEEEEEEEEEEQDVSSDDKPRLVMRKLKVQKRKKN